MSWDEMTNEALIEEYKETKSNELFEYFVNRNKGLIYHYAKRLLRLLPNERESIEQKGKIAMWKAMRYFDPAKSSFSNYFRFFMLREIKRQLYEMNTIKIPWNELDSLSTLIENNMLTGLPIISLEQEIAEDYTVGDTIANESDTENGPMQNDIMLIKIDLLKYIKYLPPRENRMITEYYGLEDGVPKTLQELGNKYGVTRERIRQILAKGIKKLRNYVKE